MQHGVVLRHDRDHHGWIFRALALVDARGVCRHDESSARRGSASHELRKVCAVPTDEQAVWLATGLRLSFVGIDGPSPIVIL